ncbi:alpha/beta hydrolase [Candidatus Woesearchaeota archaeon]|nr:alpha/beta hydrolase [Candidatus Woesearchaeota archaeon]
MQQKITFKDSIGTKLVGILSDPNPEEEKPVIICVHGFIIHKNNSTNTFLKETFDIHNIASFRIDLYGHGESGGKFKEITITKATDGILKAIELMKEKGYKKIGLIGSSFGGISSTIAASKTNDLFVLGLKCPVSNYKDKHLEQKSKEELKNWKEQGYISHKSSRPQDEEKLNYTFFEDYDANDGYKAAENIDIPVVIVHGAKDVDVPVKQSKKISKIFKNCELHIMENATHYFENEGEFEEMIKIISNFVIKHAK